jgi:hypothetical protein
MGGIQGTERTALEGVESEDEAGLDLLLLPISSLSICSP